jgi:hypothetical protein
MSRHKLFSRELDRVICCFGGVSSGIGRFLSVGQASANERQLYEKQTQLTEPANCQETGDDDERFPQDSQLYSLYWLFCRFSVR